MIQRKSFFAFLLVITLSSLPLLLSAQKPCDYIKGVTKVTGFITPTCFGFCDGLIVTQAIVPIPTGIPIKYYINNDTSFKTPFFPNLCSGWQQIVSENRLDGCRDTVVTFLPQPDSISLSVKIDTVTCKTGSFTATASGGVGKLNISWNPAPNVHSPKLSDISMGQTYTVTARDEKQCTNTLQVTMPKSKPLNLKTIANDITCKGENSGNIYLFPNGKPPYNYQWADKNGINPNNTSKWEHIKAGFYHVTVTDANGCVEIDTINLKPYPFSSFSILGLEKICPGKSLMLTTNVNATSYLWSTGEMTQSIQINKPGNYTITISDNKGCTAISNKIISQSFDVNTQIKKSICKGESYLFNNQKLTKSGVYQAILPALNSCDSITTLNLEVKPNDTIHQEIIICAGTTGMISTTFKNKLGCDSTVILSTKIAPTLNVTISRKDSTFSIVTPISGVTYQWLWYNKEIIGANSSTFTAKDKGLYSLRITDTNGCVFTSSQLPFGNIATSDISQNNIKIYPNPIQEQLTISSETNIQKVEFYNIIGQVLLSQKIDNQTFTINTNFLTTGIYFIRIYQNNNEFQIFKITKA
jgi:hypothetical protein